MRLESDQVMSAAWILIPLLPIVVLVIGIVAFIATLATSFTTISPVTSPSPGTVSVTRTTFLFPAFIAFFLLIELVGFLGAILYAYMIYKLVHRRNRHFLRQAYLYDDLTNLTKELAGKKGVDMSIPLNNMDRSSREAKFEETEKSAALWAILSFFIPFVNLYVFYFLMKDFFRHERHEDAFIEDLNRALASAGVAINLPRRTIPVPDRSFILYFILSIITVGIFSIYWIYILLEDPNNHFRHQAMVEDTIITQVSSLPV